MAGKRMHYLLLQIIDFALQFPSSVKSCLKMGFDFTPEYTGLAVSERTVFAIKFGIVRFA